MLLSLNDDQIHRASPKLGIDQTLPRLHILKMPDRALIKMYCWFLLITFIICPVVIDPPLTVWTLPPNVTKTATDILFINLIILVAAAAYISFYRKKTTFRLSDTGIQIQDNQLISWQSILWYRMAIYSGRGIRAIILKTKDRKIRIVSEDDNALMDFERDLKLFITTYNPSAHDYKDLKASKMWGYVYMAIVTIAYLAGGIILKFNLIYILLGTFTLPVIFLMIYVENIKGKPWNVFE